MAGSRNLVLHALGSAAGGAPWRDAFAAVGLVVDAPDLPGHGSAQPIVGRSYQIDDPAAVAAAWFGEHERAGFVVGVGATGWVAQVTALAGRCDRLVLVDALGGPFIDGPERMAARRERVRSVVATGDAPMVDGLDPRAAFLPTGHQDLALAQAAVEALPVPTLVIETPDSSTWAEAAAEVAAPLGGVHRLGDASPSRIAAAVRDWLAVEA